MRVDVQNLVLTARVAESLAIPILAKTPPFDSRGKRAQHWLSLRVGPRERYVALYPKGTALVTGCKSEAEGVAVLEEVRLLLPPDARYPELRDVTIQNMVGLADLGREVPLSELLLAFPESIEFEPEQFPGALVSTSIGKTKALLFSSGKMVVTGARSVDELNQAAAEVEGLIAKAGV